MDIGMLWFDDSNRKLEEKISKAVEHYKQKYGLTPTVCFVNPNALGEGAPETAAGVQLRALRTVMAHHLWIGVEEAAARTNGNGNGRKK